MMALVMAGGRGSRMAGTQEKLLLRYKKPLVTHVIDALREYGRLEEILAATSPRAPRTEALLSGLGVRTIRTAGDGYVQDLGRALQHMSGRALVVPGDMPLLDGKIVGSILSRYSPASDWTSFVITEDYLASLGLSAGFSVTCGGVRCAYTGISVVNARAAGSHSAVKEHLEIINDRRIAFNLNTRRECGLLGLA